MTLQTTKAISLSNIQTEFGGSSPISMSEYYRGGAVTAYSDPRLKENFKRIEDPMKIIYSLDGGTFQWKRGYQHTECKAGKRDYGVLADQVESVMPEIVAESIELDGQQYKTVSYEKIVPVLIEAVKVLSDRINALEVANGD